MVIFKLLLLVSVTIHDPHPTFKIAGHDVIETTMESKIMVDTGKFFTTKTACELDARNAPEESFVVSRSESGSSTSSNLITFRCDEIIVN